MDSRHQLLDGFPVVVTLPVLWGDEDSFRHVNNTVYLRWAETARVEYLIRAGIWRRYYEDKVGPIVAKEVSRAAHRTKVARRTSRTYSEIHLE